MKKLIVSLSVLGLIAFTSCKDNAAQKIDETNVAAAAERDANATKYPVMEFDKTDHDFGEIEAHQNVETVFTYKNVGQAPLVITNIASSCGCTVPQDWSKEPLAVGETGQFTVKFNGSGSNKVSKTVTITANTEKGKEMVKISAFVKPDPNKPAPVNPAVQPGAAVTPVVKSSTQPGHEGHNHD
ncbi:MAG TPA: DUF1573 domain-containing protein [Flavobacteriaceae bacterium]|nr:DUF1573 domain-containing protein [Flavobacteriaceae bacterium]